MRVFQSKLFMDKDELKREAENLAEKIGEPCVVLPAYLEAHNQNIAYVCDGYACDVCHPEYCHHTTDIRHAKHFAELSDGRYIEEIKE